MLLTVLVVICLVLLTEYFGESASSPLHRVQRGIVAVLAPAQSGASTVFSPVSDVANWVSSTLSAKTRSDQLEQQLHTANAELARLRTKRIDDVQLGKLAVLDKRIGIGQYNPVAASVTGRDPSLWYQTVEVDAGSGSGVSAGDPVIADGALVGKVTEVTGDASIVTLITNASSSSPFSVAATVTDEVGDTGVLVPAVGNPGQMQLQDLRNNAQIQPGQQVVTAGWRDEHNPQLRSLYPPGILIGTVANFSPSELLNNGQVPVTPAADVRNFTVAQILTQVAPATQSAQVVP